MRSRIRLLILAGAAACQVLPAVAEVDLQSARWQLVQRKPSRTSKAHEPEDLSALAINPGGNLSARLLAKLRLLNRGAAMEAVLLRYTLSAKISAVDGRFGAAWSIPFLLGERRVPRIGANQFLEVALDPSADIGIYLKNIFREGFWPEQLKLQVMVQPRRGQKTPVQILESTLFLSAKK